MFVMEEVRKEYIEKLCFHNFSVNLKLINNKVYFLKCLSHLLGKAKFFYQIKLNEERKIQYDFTHLWNIKK